MSFVAASKCQTHQKKIKGTLLVCKLNSKFHHISRLQLAVDAPFQAVLENASPCTRKVNQFGGSIQTCLSTEENGIER